MSYILDALKKAEAERHLGDVPSIHAAAGAAAQTETQASWRKHLPWMIAGLLAVALLAYVLWSHPWSSESAPPPVVLQPTVAQQPVAPAAPVVENPPPAPTPAPVAVPAAPAHPAAALAEKPAHAPPAVEKPKAEEAKPASAAVAPTAPTAPAEDEPGTMQDLPAAIQRELPPVSINGYIYAKNPVDRTALINKRLLHEGDTVAPDLVLEKLTPKGAVLNFKGYRYRVNY